MATGRWPFLLSADRPSAALRAAPPGRYRHLYRYRPQAEPGV